MAALTDFLDYIMVELPGADIALVKQKVLESCIEFCARTKVYTVTLPAIDVVSGTASYTLDPESGYIISDVMADGVVYNGVMLNPSDPVSLDDVFTDWRTTGSGAPSYYLLSADRTTLTLVETPDASITGGLVVTVAEKPTINATTVPDVLLSRYHEAVKCGALGALFAMKRKPWSDTSLATFHMQRFNALTGRADSERAKSFTRKSLRTTTVFR